MLDGPEARQAAATAGLDDRLEQLQEAVAVDSRLFLAFRESVARWSYLAVDRDGGDAVVIDASRYLAAKERAVGDGSTPREPWVLELDFDPFRRGFPTIREASSIGAGGDFLAEQLVQGVFSTVAGGIQGLVDFLREHRIQGRSVLLGEGPASVEGLREALRRGEALLRARPPEEPAWRRELEALGFEPGWGRTARRAAETMGCLIALLDNPTPRGLTDFLSRAPMLATVAILSPHGFFAQAGVLGKPDTGGQVVYILDQVRALEAAMRAALDEAGLTVDPRIVVLTRLIPDAEGTTCDQPVERIEGTEHAVILRVPFRTPDGAVVPEWISRFDIWPFLERYAVEAEAALLEEVGAKPELVIGNYSDGNLVAGLMAERLGVTRCTIAHALEKSKYRNSDLQWRELEADNHFSCQFAADLFAMNTADFVITSSYQEIAGTARTVGQYESYRSFTLPGLYRVVAGIDCFDPRFNIVPPGADPRVFFPFSEEDRRSDRVREEVRALVYGAADDHSRGCLADPAKPLIFSMSRLDWIKNMAGLVEAYGASPELQARTNLLIVGGTVDPDRSGDRDERDQIERIQTLIDEGGLQGSVRWIELQTDKHRVGEFYRVVADSRGAFVQPALFEAFGLTVVEALSTGLPTFATRHGGPLEIVEDDVSGFHIDPNAGFAMVEPITEFYRSMDAEPGRWDRISQGSVRRVRERYNWPLYAERLLALSGLYGLWRHVTAPGREGVRRYLEMFYGLGYRPRAQSLEQGDPESHQASAPPQ